MKALKIIGIIILAIVVIVLVLALVAPKKYEVSRSIVIHADSDLVFRQVQYWRNWGAWSPWGEKDSTMTITVTGIDGQPDSKYIWDGDPKKTGSGEMTNTGLIPGEEMTFHLHFKTPWESQSDGWVRVNGMDDGTEASWGFYGSEKIPLNILLLFMPMDKMIGPDFERGMQLLKEVVEAKAAKMAELKIQELTYRSTNIAAIRQQVEMGEMKSFFENSYAAISKAMMENGVEMTGAPLAVFYSWDEEIGIADVAAGIPVNKNVQTGDVQMMNVPAGKALAIDYYGPYDETELAHLALSHYMQEHEIMPGELVIEEYLTDPGSVSNPNEWLTRVAYFIE